MNISPTIGNECYLPVTCGEPCQGCKLPEKGQMANSFRFVGYAVSVAVTQLCHSFVPQKQLRYINEWTWPDLARGIYTKT